MPVSAAPHDRIEAEFTGGTDLVGFGLRLWQSIAYKRGALVGLLTIGRQAPPGQAAEYAHRYCLTIGIEPRHLTELYDLEAIDA
jgi:hypothetical protein